MAIIQVLNSKIQSSGSVNFEISGSTPVVMDSGSVAITGFSTVTGFTLIGTTTRVDNERLHISSSLEHHTGIRFTTVNNATDMPILQAFKGGIERFRIDVGPTFTRLQSMHSYQTGSLIIRGEQGTSVTVQVQDGMFDVELGAYSTAQRLRIAPDYIWKKKLSNYGPSAFTGSTVWVLEQDFAEDTLTQTRGRYSLYVARNGTTWQGDGIQQFLTSEATANGSAQLSLGNGKLFIQNTGFVGIGTEFPGTKLDVDGTIRSRNSSNYIQIRHDGSNPYLTWTGGNGLILFSLSANKVILPASNNEYQLGADTSRFISAYSNIVYSRDVRTESEAMVVGTPHDYNLTLRTNNLPRITVQNDGKVGFNTVAPTELLHMKNGHLRQEGTGSIYNDFISGFAGAGHRLDRHITEVNKSNLELDNLTVRGRMRIYELLINQIRATNGSLFVTSVAKVKTSTLVTGNTYRLGMEDNLYVPFTIGDLVKAQRFTGAGTRLVEGEVVAIEAGNVVVTNNGTVRSFDVTIISGSDTPLTGDDFVRIGHVSDPTRQGTVYLTSDDSNAPYIDITDGVTSFADWGSYAKTKVRLGRLSGVTIPHVGTAERYGIFAQTGYFVIDANNLLKFDSSGFVLKATNVTLSGSNVAITATDKFTITTPNVLIDSLQSRINLGSNALGKLVQATDVSFGTGFAVSGSGEVRIQQSATDFIKAVAGTLSIGASNFILSSSTILLNSTVSGGVVSIASGTAISDSGVYLDGNGAINLAVNSGNYIRRVGTTLVIRSTDAVISGSNTTIDSTNFELNSVGIGISSVNNRIRVGSGSMVILSGSATEGNVFVGQTSGSQIVMTGNANSGVIRSGKESAISTTAGFWLSSAVTGGVAFHLGNATDYLRMISGSVEAKLTNATISGSSITLNTPNFVLGGGTINATSAGGGSFAIGTATHITGSDAGSVFSGSGEFRLTYDANNYIRRIGSTFAIAATTATISGSTVTIGAATFRLATPTAVLDSVGTGKFALGTNADTLTVTSSTGVFVSGSGAFNFAKDGSNYVRNDGTTFTIRAENAVISGSSVTIGAPVFRLAAITLVIDSAGSGKIALGTGADTLTLASTSGVVISGTGDFNFAGDANNYIRKTGATLSLFSTTATISGSAVTLGATTFRLATPTAVLDSTGTGKFALGTGADALTATSTSGVFISGSGAFNFATDAGNYVRSDGTTFSIRATNAVISGSSVVIGAPAFRLDSATIVLDSAGTGKLAIGAAADTITAASTTGVFISGSGAFNFARDANNYVRNDGTAFSIRATSAVISGSNVTIGAPTFRLDSPTIVLDSAGSGKLALGASAGTITSTSNTGVFVDGDGAFNFAKDANNYVRFDGTTFALRAESAIISGSSVTIGASIFRLDATTVVIDSATSGKIALGPNANTLHVSSSAGVFVSGTGDFNFAGDASNYIRKIGSALSIFSTNATISGSSVVIGATTFELTADGLSLSSANRTLSLGTSGSIKLVASGATKEFGEITVGADATNNVKISGTTTQGIIRTGKTSATDTTSGFWLANNAGDPELHVGNATGYLKFDGGVFDILTSRATISGSLVTIGATDFTLTAPNIRLASADGGVAQVGSLTSLTGSGAGVFFSGSGEFRLAQNATNYVTFTSANGLEINTKRLILDSANFKIDALGNIVASNGVFSGSIYATSGQFSGSINATTGNISNVLTIGGTSATGSLHLDGTVPEIAITDSTGQKRIRFGLFSAVSPLAAPNLISSSGWSALTQGAGVLSATVSNGPDSLPQVQFAYVSGTTTPSNPATITRNLGSVLANTTLTLSYLLDFAYDNSAYNETDSAAIMTVTLLSGTTPIAGSNFDYTKTQTFSKAQTFKNSQTYYTAVAIPNLTVKISVFIPTIVGVSPGTYIVRTKSLEVTVTEASTQLTQDRSIFYVSPKRYIDIDRQNITVKSDLIDSQRIVAGELEVYGKVSVFGDYQASTVPPSNVATTNIGWNLTGSGLFGTNTDYSRADHTHNVTSAAIVGALGYTPGNSTGSAGTLTVNTTSNLTGGALLNLTQNSTLNLAVSQNPTFTAITGSTFIIGGVPHTSYFKHNDFYSWTSPFGWKNLRSPEFTYLYSADKRFVVTYSGASSGNTKELFQGTEVNAWTIPAGQTSTVHIDLLAKGTYGGNGLVYAESQIYIGQYSSFVAQLVRVRFKLNNGDPNNTVYTFSPWSSHVVEPSSNGNGTALRISMPGFNYAVGIEVEVTAPSGNDAWINAIFMVPDRQSGPIALINKLVDVDLYYEWKWINGAMKNKVVINSDATAPLFVDNRIRTSLSTITNAADRWVDTFVTDGGGYPVWNWSRGNGGTVFIQTSGVNFTGFASFSNGLAVGGSDPSLIVNGVGYLRLASGGAYSLYLETNGLRRMTVSSTGDIGIGTETPGARLDVQGGNLSVNGFVISAALSNGTGNPTIRGLGAGSFGIEVLPAANQGFVSYRAEHEKGSIYTDGRVTVSGNEPAHTFNTRGNRTVLTDALFRVQNAGSTKFTVTAGGKVGIGGADTPPSNLTITNNVSSGQPDTFDKYQILLYSGSSAAASYGIGIESGFQWFNAVGYKFYSNGGAPVMTIDQFGNTSVTGTITATNLNQKNFSVGVPATIGDAIEFASVTNGHFSSNVELWLTVHDGNFAQSKRYIVPVQYAGTSGNWRKCLPISTTGPYSGNDCEIDVHIADGMARFRIRRTAGATVGTAKITLAI